MNDQLIHRITKASLDVFSTMFGQSLTVRRQITDSTETGPTDGVAAIVGLAGPVAGTGSVTCSVETACHIASLMLMAEYKEMCSDVLDAMGEVANMIIGNVKTDFENECGPIGLSTPTVIHGHDFGTRSAAGQSWTVVTFALENGQTFDVQLAITQNDANQSEQAHCDAAVSA